MATRTVTVTWNDDPADPVVAPSKTTSDQGVPGSAAPAGPGVPGPAGPAGAEVTTIYKWHTGAEVAFTAGESAVVAQMTNAFPSTLPLVGDLAIRIRPEDPDMVLGSSCGCEIDAELTDQSWQTLRGWNVPFAQGHQEHGVVVTFPLEATGRLRVRCLAVATVARVLCEVTISGTPTATVDLT